MAAEIRQAFVMNTELAGITESAHSRRALLLCGLDSSIAVLNALAVTLGNEPGWVVTSAGVSLQSNSYQEFAFPVDDAAPTDFDIALQGCINTVPSLVENLAASSGCRNVWICGFGIMATAVMLALSGGSLGIFGSSLDTSKDGVEVAGLACVGMEVPVGNGEVPEKAYGAVSEEAANDRGKPGLSHEGTGKLEGYNLSLGDYIIEAVESINALSSLMVIHGLEDKITPPNYARRAVSSCRSAKADSLRLLGGAGHDLYADPRVVALLIGWMDRTPL